MLPHIFEPSPPPLSIKYNPAFKIWSMIYIYEFPWNIGRKPFDQSQIFQTNEY